MDTLKSNADSNEFYYEILNTKFDSNIGFQGGGIYLNNPESALLKNTTFYSNKAQNSSTIDKSGYGGGLYYTCGANN